MDSFDLRLWKGFAQAGGDLSAPAFTDQITIDSNRVDSPYALFVALQGASQDGHKFVDQAAQAGARYALVSLNWQPNQPLEGIALLRVENPLRAFQDIAHAYRMSTNCQVIAIAGSHGKTMVKDLLQTLILTEKPAVASPESFNSQIGVPLSLLNIKKGHEIALIEAGISKKFEMDTLAEIIAPDACIVTHIGKKHITSLGDIKTASTEILKICKHPRVKQWMLLPKDTLVQQHLRHLPSGCYFWNEPGAEIQLPHANPLALEHSSHLPYHIEFPDGNQYSGHATFGFYYFIDLVNIAIKAAWLLGISSNAIRQVLQQYTPEPMRTEFWKSPIGACFINDAYSSDPQSVDQALKYFTQAAPHNRKIFVFGGMRGTKDHSSSDYRRVGKAVARARPDRLILVGNHPFSPLIDEVKQHLPKTEISLYPCLQDAFQIMRTCISHDDIILIKGEKKEPLETITEAFNDSISSNQCIINLAAIQSNIETLRHKLPQGTRLMIMVKALAYGTDDIRMARYMSTCGIDILGVSYVDEGAALKRAGIGQEIFVINAAIYEIAKIVKWGLQAGVSDRPLIEALAAEAEKQQKKIKVHLHVDSGMNRFGCCPEGATELALLIRHCPSLEFEGIMTHFASADNPKEDEFTLLQAARFEQAIQEIESHGIPIPWKHAANSSGAVRFQFPQFNMVRVGLAAYGLYSSEAAKEALELRLALSLISRIVGINVCKAGDTVSYGRSYIVEREKQRIAVLPIGYFDGLHRNYSGKAHVIIRGKKAPMVGKICMDFMMVDVTDIPHAAIGDPVLIFGEDEYGHYLSPEDLASQGNSIVHELVTCLGPRIQRIFVHEEANKFR
jgi:Alr-MurF fusion protein